jgi:DNA ligase D
VKYDGYRALSALSNRRLAMWTRNKLELASRFPGVARALSQVVVGDAVIDGEIAVLDAEGVSRFELIQQERDDALLFAFDLQRLDGEDLRARPIEPRRDLLRSLLSNAPPELRLSEEVPGPIEEALAAMRRRGMEGLILKRKGSPYEHKRSRDWLKLKAQATQELAIIGWTPGKGAASGSLGALLLAVADGKGGYEYAGKVGTGFTAKQRQELKRELSRDEIDAPPARGAPRLRDAHWVKPRLVAQVRFTEWTCDGKLRHPAFQGLRLDKSPEECVRERPGPQTKPAATVELTNPGRELYPGITKRDVAEYYDAVSAPLLRAIAGRPLALVHWNKGISRPRWFHQNTGDDAEPWMTVVETPTRTKQGAARHLVADRPEVLRFFAQRAALEIRAWHSRAESLTQPDWVLGDLFEPAGAWRSTATAATRAKKLADSLQDLRGTRDLLILALPRGGVPAAERVARRLGAPLDVYVVRKIGLPGHEEVAMGAVASGGIVLVNPALVEQMPEEQFRWALERAAKELNERERLYRGGRPPPDVAGRTVVLIDDGLATGATMRAPVEVLRRRGPLQIIVAVPIASPETCEDLAREVDRVVCAATPRPFHAVGLWYQDFSATTDDEVRHILASVGSGRLDLRHLGEAAGALREPRLERAIGVLYLPSTERGSHYFAAALPSQFDAVIHLDATTAVEPLERMALWDVGEPPETYPTGI